MRSPVLEEEWVVDIESGAITGKDIVDHTAGVGLADGAAGGRYGGPCGWRGVGCAGVDAGAGGYPGGHKAWLICFWLFTREGGIASSSIKDATKLLEKEKPRTAGALSV